MALGFVPSQENVEVPAQLAPFLAGTFFVRKHGAKPVRLD